MVHSEEKRIADEITYDLLNNDKWLIIAETSDYARLQHADSLIELRVCFFIWPACCVEMQKPLEFKFSYSLSYKMTRLVKSYIKMKRKEEKEKEKNKAMKDFKSLYVKPVNGNLFIYDKIKCKNKK